MTGIPKASPMDDARQPRDARGLKARLLAIADEIIVNRPDDVTSDHGWRQVPL